MRRTLAAAALAALAALPAAAQDRSPKPPPDAQPVVVSFELEANLVWVEARLDGKGPFRMAVDTGASTTVVLPDAARELGLDVEEPSPGTAAQFVKVRKVSIGDLDVADVKVAVMEVPQLSLPAGALRMQAHGVLGYNVISRFVTTFDYRRRTISFAPSDYVPADPDESLPGVTRAPRTWLGVQVDDVDPRDVKIHGYDGGVRVVAVEELSPAERAGLREGDVLVDIAGTPLVRPQTLRDWLRRAAPGQKVVVTFLRNGEIWEADVTVARVRAKAEAGPK